MILQKLSGVCVRVSECMCWSRLMSFLMCVCAFVCSVSMYVSIYICMYVLYISVCVCLYIYIYIYIYMYIYIYNIHTYICVHKCVYICMYLCIYVCTAGMDLPAGDNGILWPAGPVGPQRAVPFLSVNNKSIRPEPSKSAKGCSWVFVVKGDMEVNQLEVGKCVCVRVCVCMPGVACGS
jgi:hypothetical protein